MEMEPEKRIGGASNVDSHRTHTRTHTHTHTHTRTHTHTTSIATKNCSKRFN